MHYCSRSVRSPPGPMVVMSLFGGSQEWPNTVNPRLVPISSHIANDASLPQCHIHCKSIMQCTVQSMTHCRRQRLLCPTVSIRAGLFAKHKSIRDQFNVIIIHWSLNVRTSCTLCIKQYTTFDHNLGKYRPICKILSPTDS